MAHFEQKSSIPLFISSLPINVTTTKNSCFSKCPAKSNLKSIVTCSHADKVKHNAAISRRQFSALLAATPLFSLPLESRADISGLVTPYKDLPKGFSILRPNGWNEFEGLQDQYDIKWQDVIQPLEFVTVLTSPVSKGKTLSDIGELSGVGNKLAGGRGGQLVKATEKDIDGVAAYVFEIKRGSSHQLTLLAINKQKLYSVNASCAEKRWGKREKLLRGVVDSFRPKL